MDWNDPGSKAYANALNQSMAEDVATVASVVALRCPTCLSGRIAGAADNGATGVQVGLQLQAGQNPDALVPMVAGMKAQQMMRRFGFSESFSARTGGHCR